MARIYDEREHKAGDSEEDDEGELPVLSSLKKKPGEEDLHGDQPAHTSKVKPKMKEKDSKKKKHKGEVLTPEAALDFMIKERQDFDFETAALRAENDRLREGLEKYKHLSPSKQKEPTLPEPEIVEKVVIKKILDPNGKKYKQDAEQLSAENEKLKQQHLEMEALLEQQRQLAEEAQQHPISKRKSTHHEESVPETHLPPNQHKTAKKVEKTKAETKKKSDKKPKKNVKKEIIQKSMKPVSANNCSTFPMLLWNGAILWKIPYNGRGVPERRLVMIKRASLPGKKSKPVQLLVEDDEDNIANNSKKKKSDTYITNPPTIIWANPDKPNDIKSAREIILYEGAHVVMGHQSPAFWKSKSRGTPLPPEQFCFSIITSSRSLDLAAESIEEVVAWKNALHMLLVMMSSNQNWAIDNLLRKQPVWHHEELENHSSQKAKKKDQEITVGESTSRKRDEEYEIATQKAKELSLKDQMFAATRSADINKLENVLKTKISVNLMDNETSDTVLMIACRAGLDKIAKLCLDYGGRNDPHPDFGQTALHCAIESRSYKCARVLLEIAAASQADHVISNLRDSGDQTPLHISANFGDTKMSKILVSHGACIDSVDSKGRAPLHLCAGSGHKICLSFLLDNGGDLCIDMGDGQGNTPLHYSAENGHLTCCRLLLETAANPIARNVHQQTPYNLASMRGHQKICLLLLDYQDSAARTSFHTSPPRSGPQRSSSLDNLSSPYPNQLERSISLPNSAPVSSPLFYQQPQQKFFPHSSKNNLPTDSNPCALPRPHSARTNSTGSTGSNDHLLQQYPFTARDRTHTSNSLMPDLNSPVMNHPHSARDRTAPLFEGLSVNSGYLKQQNNFFTQESQSTVQENLQKNIFNKSHAITSMDNVPQSPVSTPNRKSFRHQSPSPVAQKYDYDSNADYNAPYEEFELFDTLWHVYWTEEGYAYYLDSQTQHSQWDDPRTHGLLRYDELTGELITDPATIATEKDDDYELNDEVKLALQQQDEFLQPKTATPKREPSPQKRPLPKRVQSMKPQKFTAESSDMSPFKTDDSDDNSDSEFKRFSVPAKSMQSRSGAFSKKNKFGSRSLASSSDEDSLDCTIPRISSRTRKESPPRRVESDFKEGDEVKPTSKSGTTKRKGNRPSGNRQIPLLSEKDEADFHTRRRQEVEDKDLDYDSDGSGTWFTSGGIGSNEGDEDELDLNQTVSRLVQPPTEPQPLKTNCFSPDKASLLRAEQLQRKVSSGASPSPPNSSDFSDMDENGVNDNQINEDLSNVPVVPDNEHILVASMQLESDNDDDDDYFDTIITMKKDELASAESGGLSEGTSTSDYMSFLSKVENEVKSSTPQKISSTLDNLNQASLALTLEDSDWDDEMDEQNKLKELASAEKDKQKKIFDTSRDGDYGNGGNMLKEEDAEDGIVRIHSKENSPRKDLQVETNFPPQGENDSVVPALQSGGDSPFIKSDHGSPNLEERVKPYLDFLEAGNTVRQVRRQMEKDNQSKELIKLMIQRSDDVTSTISVSRKSTEDASNSAPSKATPEELANLKQDAVIGKYIKMATMGVPYGNVEHKMKSEGVDADDMLRVAVALGHGPSAPATRSSTSIPEFRPNSRKSSVSLVKMHWNTLPPEKLENSIWANNEGDDSMEESEMKELEKLFAASGNSGTDKTGRDTNVSSNSGSIDPKLKLYVLESRRAQNIVIGLSQFKGLKSHKDILEAVCQLDDLQGNLNLDKLQNLVPLLPTLHESKKMAGAHESQHPAEVFFNIAITYYPELLKRLNCFITCLTFADTSESLLAKMRSIIEACNEVISSDSLARILQKMLTVGNLMNEGTYRGHASGFTLDSLLKMVQTKGVDKKTSVLDYVIKSLIEKGDERLLRISDTLEVDEETTRLSGRDCSREIDHLLKDFHSLEDEYKKAVNNQVEALAVCDFTPVFTDRMSDFLEYASEKVKEINKVHDLMKRKIIVVVEYFGEDVETCQTTKIFSVLRQFLVAFEISKKALIERRLRKQNRS